MLVKITILPGAEIIHNVNGTIILHLPEDAGLMYHHICHIVTAEGNSAGDIEKIEYGNGAANIYAPMRRRGIEVDRLASEEFFVPLAHEWKPWNGGGCPVPGSTRVWVRLRGGWINEGTADRFSWHHADTIYPESHIIAYAVL